MKNSILILLFTCLFLNSKTLIGQDNGQSKLRIGLSASIEKNTSSERVAFSQYTGFFADYDKLNYRFGLDLEYRLKNKLTINGAIKYSNKNFTGTYYCDVCDFTVLPSPEDVDFTFIEVPIIIKYYFLPDKIRLFGEAGLNNLFALNHLGYEARVNSFAIGLKIGSGIEYNLSQKIALQLKIDYNKSISRVFKDSDFKMKSLNIGIGIIKKI